MLGLLARMSASTKGNRLSQVEKLQYFFGRLSWHLFRVVENKIYFLGHE